MSNQTKRKEKAVRKIAKAVDKAVHKGVSVKKISAVVSKKIEESFKSSGPDRGDGVGVKVLKLKRKAV